MKPVTTLLLALCLPLVLAGCGAAGGPGGGDIEQAARKQMAASLEGGAMSPADRAAFEASLKDAKIAKKGMCNPAKKPVYACMVDVTIKMPGAAQATTQTMVVEIAKGPDGVWK